MTDLSPSVAAPARRGEIWWVDFDPTRGSEIRKVGVCDQIRAVDKRRLSRSAGRLAAADLRAVEEGLRVVLEL